MGYTADMMDASPLRPHGGPWRLLPFSDAPMGRQFALSEGALAALDCESAPALRWYIPAERALVLGNGQSPSVVDTDRLATRGVALYRRSSGGTAVLVDQTLLSLDIILPHSHPLATTDVVRAYEWIGALWAAALRGLGAANARALPTSEARAAMLPTDDPLRLACYGGLSPWEVVVSQPPRKLVGLCQTRRRYGALYQTGVYLRFDAAALADLLALSADMRAMLASSLADAAIGLDEASGARWEPEAITAAFERTMSRRLGESLLTSDWRPDELAHADRLAGERFYPLA